MTFIWYENQGQGHLEGLLSSSVGLKPAVEQKSVHAGQKDSVLSANFFDACDKMQAKYALNLGTGKYHKLVTSEDGRISRGFYERDENLCQLLEPVAGNRLVPFRNEEDMSDFLRYRNVDPDCQGEPCKIVIDFESRANYLHEVLDVPLKIARGIVRKYPLKQAELCKYDYKQADAPATMVYGMLLEGLVEERRYI